MRWAILLVFIASLRIVSTYRVLSHTTDEPAHLAAGMQYLETGKYLYEDQHPPLARVIGAIGLRLTGARSQGEPDMYIEGFHLLGAAHRYRRNLFYSRLAMLPLFWIAAAVVYRWTKRLADTRAAILAVLAFSSTPAILGHAGLVTTDMALAAFTGAALLATVEFGAKPDLRRALILGLCVALAVLSKFSALVFLPAASLVLFRCRRLRDLRYLPVAIGAAVLVVWAFYLFSFQHFFAGLESVRQHNEIGHPSFLLGEVRQKGFWYYYPVVIAFKTPLALLVLAALSRQWRLLCVAAAIVLAAMPGHINIGIRHILPIFIPLAICAGIAASQLPRLAVAGLFAWLFVSVAQVHPDYISYVNELALGHPENILADSDLDWEQGFSRLNARLRALKVDHFNFRYSNSGYFMAGNGFVPFDHMPDGDTPPPGWSAVSITTWKLTGQPLWAAHAQPRERIAHSILLYWFPPGKK